MQLKTILSGLLGMGVMVGSAFSQTPQIDAFRWTNAGGLNTALPQTQGFGQGAPTQLTWGFAREGAAGSTFIPGLGLGVGANSNLVAFMDGIYGAGPGGANLTLRPWFINYQRTFDRWSSISGLSYQYEANDDGATYSDVNSNATRGILGTRADLRIGGRSVNGASGILAFNFFAPVGDMVVNTAEPFFNNTAGSSLGLRNVLAHEHGHGLGMRHVEANNSSQLMEPFIDLGFDGPQHHDILVAQRGYGDANERSFGNLGNDISARATPLGAIPTGTTTIRGQNAGTFPVAPTSNQFFSIDDNLDTDFWSFSISGAGEVDILLQALGFTYNTAPQGAGSIESFNSRSRSDLALALIGTDGSTVLSSINAGGLGANEQILDFFLPSAGTYFVRITGTDNADTNQLDTQFYGLNVGYVASPIPEPGVAGLLMVGLGLIQARRRRS